MGIRVIIIIIIQKLRTFLQKRKTEEFSLSNENHENLKYFKNDYCVMTNQSQDQDTCTSHHKLITVAACSLLVFPRPD